MQSFSILLIDFQFIKKYRIILFDAVIKDLQKSKLKRVIICNDVFVIVKLDCNEIPCKFIVKPISIDMNCIVSENICTISSFGWELWSWESLESTSLHAAFLRAKRYISVRTNLLFNRTGTSVDSLLPLELVKLVKQLYASQVSKIIKKKQYF